NHDTAVRENPRLSQAPVAPVAPGSAVTPPLNDSAVYSNLAPYGYWDLSPDYGYYWQPYSWLGYDYYPWGWLSFGFWWNFPGRGWCWFPHSHFRGFNHFHGTRSFAGNRLAFNRV